MKKCVLILLFVLLSYGLYAQQQRDFASFNHRIDSLTQVYSTKEFKNIRGAYVNFDNSNLSAKEKEKLITKIRKLFRQNNYPNLYFLGHRILYDMWSMRPDNNSFETKRELTELHLQYYFYPGVIKIIYSYPDRNYSYYSKKAKIRIIEILEGKKTKEEYEAWLNFEKSIPENIIGSRKKAEYLMKQQKIQNDTIFQQLRDSIYLKYVSEGAKDNFESRQIKPDLIKMIGLLDMKECVPVLKKNLQECIQNKCLEEQIKAYRYVLARFEDKEQRQYILDSLMNIKQFDRLDFIYFQDDEMIWRYIDVNYYSNQRLYPNSEGDGITAALQTMNNIMPFIKNLPKELEYPRLSKNMDDDYKWSKSLYEWLMANKNTVKFDYSGNKNEKWFW